MEVNPPVMKRSGKIVVAEHTTELLASFCEVLEGDGYLVYPTMDGATALALVRREAPDLVLTNMQMPALNGVDLCRHIKNNPCTRLIPVMVLTGFGAGSDRLAAIDAGADDYLTKPIQMRELLARVRSLMRLKRFTDDLDSAEAILLSLARTVEARDKYTSGHCERMAAYAATLGVHLGLSEEEIGALRRGGYLHDLGKIGIPDAILLKAGALSPDEFDVVKQHTTIGDGLCGTLRLLRQVRPIVRFHHERRDGSGYPDGLVGDDIPLLAQIVGIADVYDALTSARPYRPPLPAADACGELEREVARGWRRADLVREFIALCHTSRLGPAGLEAVVFDGGAALA